MKTYQLIILRLYMVSIGRFAIFAKLIRIIMVQLLIKNKSKGKYNASSRFFSINDLNL